MPGPGVYYIPSTEAVVGHFDDLIPDQDCEISMAIYMWLHVLPSGLLMHLIDLLGSFAKQNRGKIKYCTCTGSAEHAIKFLGRIHTSFYYAGDRFAHQHAEYGSYFACTLTLPIPTFWQIERLVGLELSGGGVKNTKKKCYLFMGCVDPAKVH